MGGECKPVKNPDENAEKGEINSTLIYKLEHSNRKNVLEKTVKPKFCVKRRVYNNCFKLRSGAIKNERLCIRKIFLEHCPTKCYIFLEP